MALIRLWGKSGVLRLPKKWTYRGILQSTFHQLFNFFPSDSPLARERCEQGYGLLTVEFSREMRCKLYLWTVNGSVFFAGHWKDTAQTTNCAYMFFFRKFTNTSNIFVVPLFWKLFRMLQQKIQNIATNLSLIQGQNSCR